MSKLTDALNKKILILRHIKHNYKDFIKAKAWTLANQLVLDEITNQMRLHNFSPKIIERTYIKDVKFIDNETLRINIISDFVAESGFKVSLAREFGTDNNQPDHKHWIRPKVKLALSWIQNGKRLFSWGHKVTGFESLKIISKTIDKQKPILIKELQKAIIEWKTNIK